MNIYELHKYPLNPGLGAKTVNILIGFIVAVLVFLAIIGILARLKPS